MYRAALAFSAGANIRCLVAGVELAGVAGGMAIQAFGRVRYVLYGAGGAMDFGLDFRGIRQNHNFHTYHNFYSKMVEQIQRLSEGTKAFQANGKEFIVHDTLTVDGYQRLEELRVEMEAGNSVGDLLSLTKKAYDLCNKGKLADAAVALYNAINIEERILDQRPAAWLLALTLFVRPRGADLSKWSEVDATEWIKDWEEEGIGAPDLFKLAFAANKALDIAFTHNSPDISTNGTGSGGSEATEASSN